MINVVLKSFPDHAGRPGLQGGSLPRNNDIVNNINVQDSVDANSFVQFFVTPNDKIVPIMQQSSHYGFLWNAMDNYPDELKNTFGDITHDNPEHMNYTFVKNLIDNGGIRGIWYGNRETNRELNLEVQDIDMKNITRIRNLVLDKVLPIADIYVIDNSNVEEHAITSMDFTYDELMTGDHIVRNSEDLINLGEPYYALKHITSKKEFIVKLKGGEGSGFHGHKGRIGKVGGSSADTFMKLPAGTRIVKPGSEAMRGSYWLLPDKRLVEIPIGMEHSTFARAFLMLNNRPDAYEGTLFREGGIRISVWLDTYFQLQELNNETFAEIQDLYLSQTLVKPEWTTEITFEDNVSDAGMTTFNYDEFLSASGIKLTQIGGVRDWQLVLKEMKIVRLKGGPGSGAHGHKGIPGHWGGGLPTINSAVITDLMTNLMDRDKVLQQLVDVLNKQFQMDVKFHSTGDIVYMNSLSRNQEISGLYDPKINTIFFARNANTGALLQNLDKVGEVYRDPDDNLLKPITGSTQRFGAVAVVLHEFAHAYDKANSYLSLQPGFDNIFSSYMDESYIPVVGKDEHIRILNQAVSNKILSAYSLSENGECFAEAFAMYALSRDYLKFAQPKMYDYFERGSKIREFNLNNVKVHKEIGEDMVEIALTDGTFVWVPRSSIKIKDNPEYDIKEFVTKELNNLLKN